MRSDWLQAFLAFSESLNFTRAAEALHISQPALHVKIAKLAERLGQPLYERQGRNLALTPAGARLAAYAREEQERAGAFLEELRTGAGRWPVVFCAGSGAYLYLLGPALTRFTRGAQHPLSLVTADRERCVALLRSGRAHLGVTVLDATPPGIAAEPLTDVGQVLVLPRSHPLARRARLRLSDLEGQALIVPPQERPHRAMINRMLMDAGVAWRVAVEAEGWELMLHFARLGLGLAIVNACCRLPAGLVARPLAALPSVRYQVLSRAGGPLQPGAAELRRLLLASAEMWRGKKGPRP